MSKSTTSPNALRGERIEARLTAEQKATLQRAAALKGNSLSEFIITGALRAAEEVIRQQATITLTAEDSQLFVEALLNPPAPTDALRMAVERYNQRFTMETRERAIPN